jgi:hypothetical protein
MECLDGRLGALYRRELGIDLGGGLVDYDRMWTWTICIAEKVQVIMYCILNLRGPPLALDASDLLCYYHRRIPPCVSALPQLRSERADA